MQIRITGAGYVTSWWGWLEREEDFPVSKISVFPPPDLNDGLAGRVAKHSCGARSGNNKELKCSNRRN